MGDPFSSLSRKPQSLTKSMSNPMNLFKQSSTTINPAKVK